MGDKQTLTEDQIRAALQPSAIPRSANDHGSALPRVAIDEEKKVVTVTMT
jgi:hypothetical protein